MSKYIKDYSTDQNIQMDVWVTRVNQLLQEKSMNQQELAQQCGLSPSVISDWFGIAKKKTFVLREPKIVGFKKVADCLGVSVDYLLGKSECRTPNDEKIHEVTGLSDRALQNLKQLNKTQGQDVDAEKQLCTINFLLENLSESQLFENLYDYLIGKVYFPGKEDDLCGIGTVEYLPSGKVSRKVTLREVFAQATFVSVQHDLMHLKDKAIEQGKLSEAHSPKSVGEQP